MTKPLKPAVKIIRQAKRTLKKGWTKEYLARDSWGIATPLNSVNAVCWCMLGALSKADVDWENYISRNARYKVFGNKGMVHFNDNAKDVDEVLGYLQHLEDVCA